MMKEKGTRSKRKICKCGCGGFTNKISHTNNKSGRIKGEYNTYISGHHSKGIPKSISQKIKMARARSKWYKLNPIKALEKNKKTTRTKKRLGIGLLDKHPRWKGGVSYGEYDFNFSDSFKKGIKNRDKICIICGLSSSELKKIGLFLGVHHIDGYKKNTSYYNCITLCQSCHASIHNGNRDSDNIINYINGLKGGKTRIKMAKKLLVTNIKRESGKLYYLKTGTDGCLVVYETDMARSGKKKKKK